MASAKIEVLEAASLTIGGRKVTKGFPTTITNPAEIELWKAEPGVLVTVLSKGGQPKKKVIVPPAPPVKKKKKVKRYTFNELKKEFSKNELVKMAKKLGVFLEGSERKDKMINSILDAQEGESE